MPLPLPRVIADTQAGGPLVTALGGMNALNNARMQTKINEVKAQYAPQTTMAEAASKLAYANLMGPQFLAKLLQNSGALGNLTEQQKHDALAGVYNAATGGGAANSLFSRMQSQTNNGQTNQGHSNYFLDKLKQIFGGIPQPTNQLLNISGLGAPQAGANAMNMQPTNAPNMQPQPGAQGGLPTEPNPATVAPDTSGGFDNESLKAYQYWLKNTPEGRASAANGGGRLPDEKALVDWYRQQIGNNPVQNEIPNDTYATNAGRFQGAEAQGKELGKIRAQDIGEVGHKLQQLSDTGTNIDRLIDDFTNPDFVSMREQFPLLQDMQLKAASKMGTPEQRHMIGSIITDMESLKASTINQFKGQTLKREFDYVDKLKPSEDDTVYTAQGKLQTLKAIHDIAEQKLQMINDLMSRKNMNLSDAIQIANKRVDIKSIDNKVKELTQPMIRVHNKSNPSMVLYLTKARAKELGIK